MRALFFVAVAAFFVALASFSPAPAPAQNEKAKAKDMAELTKLFAANNVTIMLTYNTAAITGTAKRQASSARSGPASEPSRSRVGLIS